MNTNPILTTRKFSIVAAMSLNLIIGKNNQLPWHIPKDLQHFKELTMGKTMLMGRKTFESIGRALPHRRSMVLSTQKNLQITGAEVINDIADLVDFTDEHEEIMVIGGAQVYQLLLPYCQKIHLTEIQAEIAGDACFPELDMNDWEEVSREVHCANTDNQYDFEFVELIRRG